MKKNVLTRLALFCCLIVGLSVFSATQVQAHRIWRKYTKLPNGTYTIEKAYYEQKYWQQDGVTLKLGKYFVLNSSVQKKGSGRIYTSDPSVGKDYYVERWTFSGFQIKKLTFTCKCVNI